MQHILFIISRLWRYQSIYFLKPHDAVNDTLTASLLYRLDWTGPILEIGSGDGVYSYIMHGGYFPLRFDRYLTTDLSKKDIYDYHKSNIVKSSIVLNTPNIELALDAKESHVSKIKEIGFAKRSQVTVYENLPINSATIKKIFYYTPHGLNDHDAAIREAARILIPGGTMIILVYDSRFKSSFICYRLSQALSGLLARYFSYMDNGRFDEITKLSKSPYEWKLFFRDHGFKIEKCNRGLSATAWKFYDIQTRPILKKLIKFFNCLPNYFRTFLKLIWMIIFYPYILIFYFVFSNEYLKIDRRDCYIAYQLKKITENDA